MTGKILNTILPSLKKIASGEELNIVTLPENGLGEEETFRFTRGW